MREITSHKTESNKNTVFALDERDQYQANHKYGISILGDQAIDCCLNFRTGNKHGITVEALLAVCMDRLQGFEMGPMSCPQNETAITNIKAALTALKSRTLERELALVGAAPAAAPVPVEAPAPEVKEEPKPQTKKKGV